MTLGWIVGLLCGGFFLIAFLIVAGGLLDDPPFVPDSEDHYE